MTISKKSMKWIPWILILPVVIIRGFTTLYPIIVTLKNSLFDVKGFIRSQQICRTGKLR